MKKLFLALIFSFISLESKTIVVDKHLQCSGWFWNKRCYACIDGDEKYKTLSEAVSNLKNGDDIKICKGTYYEDNLKIEKNNITIESVSKNRNDVNISNQTLNTKNNIFSIPKYVRGLTISGLGILQYASNHSGIYSKHYIRDITLSNLYIYSDGRGIYESKSISNVDIFDVDINSYKNGIYLRGVGGNIQISDVKIDTNGDYPSIKTTKFAHIKIFTQNRNFNVINSQQNGIVIDKGYVDINNTHISSKKYGIYIKNVVKTDIINNEILNGKDGIKILDSTNGGIIKDNIIKNASTFGLNLLAAKKSRHFEVTHNCFENGIGKNILSQDKDGFFNENFWNDWGGVGKYKVQNIPKYDNKPWEQCNLETTGSIYHICYATSFNSQQAFDNNWTIIKQKNYTPKIVNGRLRLTTNSGNIAVGLTLKNKIFKARNTKFKIRFKHYAYNGSSKKGADGVAIVFSDSNITPIAGAYGGSLGYAQRTTPNKEKGFNGGWIGIGLDEYGNYSNNNEGRVGGRGFTPQAIGIRGSYLENYRYLTGTDSLTPPISQGDSQTPLPGYIYEVDVDTSSGDDTIISVYRTTETGKKTLINNYHYNSKHTPEFFKFSITSSTGGENNIHELDDLEILALDCSTTLINPTHKYDFDAKEVNRTDRNITTKIVNKPFDLKILSKNNFTGTVCSAVVDQNETNISSWVKNYFDGEKSVVNQYNVAQASKNSRIKIEWLVGADVNCPLKSKKFKKSALSTDNFAVRPKKFDILGPSTIYAGGDFDIEFRALDNENNATENYDEIRGSTFNLFLYQKDGCKVGNFDGNISFYNGISDTIANYDEVGYLTLLIKDYGFADVDADDTPEKDRYIQSKSITILSYPYSVVTHTTFSKQNVIIMDKNLSHFYAELNSSIEFLNKQNEVVKNFDKNCYSDDVNMSFGIKNNISDNFIGMYQINSQELNDTNFEKFSQQWDIPKELFTQGEYNLSMKFNIHKNRAYPVSIVDFNFSRVYLNYPKAHLANTEIVDKKFSFYYLRLFVQDIFTSDINSSTNLNVIVYDRNRDHFSDEKLLYWYLDPNFNKDVIKVLGYTTSYQYDKNLTNGFNVTILRDNNEYNVSVTNPAKTHFVVIHLDTPEYLWFSKYKNYDASLNSYCLTHYCVEYTYNGVDVIKVKEIGTGKFTGSEVNITAPKRRVFGIKIYR